MTIENYQALKEVIQKANPEIMELKFGCEVLLKDFEKDFPNYVGIYAGRRWNKEIDKEVDLVVHKKSGHRHLVQMDKKYEILGRPIRLADVLLAIDQKYSDGNIRFVSDGGYFWNWDLETSPNEYGAIWNLKDDNLDNQSEETKSFLYELLCK